MLKPIETTTFAPELNLSNLQLRHWRGPADYEKMLYVLRADKHSQGMEEASTISELQAHLETLPGMDITKNIFLLEHDGKVIAYQTLRNYPESSGAYCYLHHGYVLPAWKERGIGRAMIQHSEQVLTQIAAQHTAYAEQFFQVYLHGEQTGLEHLLLTLGYTPTRYFNRMVCSLLKDIPDVPLPAGIEVRPAQPDRFHQIWQANVEGFKDHWGETAHDEADYLRWLKRPLFQPDYGRSPGTAIPLRD